jgi:hypothetical protein
MSHPVNRAAAASTHLLGFMLLAALLWPSEPASSRAPVPVLRGVMEPRNMPLAGFAAPSVRVLPVVLLPVTRWPEAVRCQFTSCRDACCVSVLLPCCPDPGKAIVTWGTCDGAAAAAAEAAGGGGGCRMCLYSCCSQTMIVAGGGPSRSTRTSTAPAKNTKTVS